jgi:hypothetical protein
MNKITFPAINAQQIRVVLTPQAKFAKLRLVEFELIGSIR